MHTTVLNGMSVLVIWQYNISITINYVTILSIWCLFCFILIKSITNRLEAAELKNIYCVSQKCTEEPQSCLEQSTERVLLDTRSHEINGCNAAQPKRVPHHSIVLADKKKFLNHPAVLKELKRHSTLSTDPFIRVPPKAESATSRFDNPPIIHQRYSSQKQTFI